MTDQPKRVDADVAPGPATAGADAQLPGGPMDRVVDDVLARQRVVHELCHRFETTFVDDNDSVTDVCGKALVVAVEASMKGHGVDPILVAGLAQRLAAITDPAPR